MNEIILRLETRNKLKNTTLKLYTRFLENIALNITGLCFKNLEFMNNIDKVKNYLSKFALATRKSRMASLITCLKTHSDIYTNIIDKYEVYLEELVKEFNNSIVKNHKSQKQLENWVTMKELHNIHSILKKTIDAQLITIDAQLITIDRSSMTKTQYHMLQDYIICSFYILQPPRRILEYSSMKYITQNEFKKLSEKIKKQNNYLVHENNNVINQFFGNYKTSSLFGNQLFQINNKLTKVLNMGLKFRLPNQQTVLINNRCKPMSSTTLCKNLIRIFETTGKKISCNMLRHIYITENITLEDSKNHTNKAIVLSKFMAHSIDAQISYHRID